MKVPDESLLLRSGIIFELITGVYVHAGLHEVVCTEKTVYAYEKAKEADKITWSVNYSLVLRQ